MFSELRQKEEFIPPLSSPKSKSIFSFRYRIVTYANVDVSLPCIQNKEKMTERMGMFCFVFFFRQSQDINKNMKGCYSSHQASSYTGQWSVVSEKTDKMLCNSVLSHYIIKGNLFFNGLFAFTTSVCGYDLRVDLEITKFLEIIYDIQCIHKHTPYTFKRV